MTVDTLSNGDDPEETPEEPLDEDDDDDRSSSSTSPDPIKSSKTFFVWKSLPSHLRPRGDEETTTTQEGSSYVCDLCGHGFAAEDGLRVHQLQLHINPFHLSVDDRNLAASRQGEEETVPVIEEPSEGDLPRPTDAEERFKGLFRCHVCLMIWNQREELKSHLDHHTVEEEAKQRAIRNAQRHEDFDDLDSPPASAKPSSKKVTKEGKENHVVEPPKKRPYKRRLSVPADSVNSSIEEVQLSEKRFKSFAEERQADEEEREEVSPICLPSSNGRPDRKCKTTTNTLVAISLEDEQLDIKFEDSSSSSEEDEVSDDDKPLKRASPPVAAAAKPKQLSKRGAASSSSKEDEEVLSNGISDDGSNSSQRKTKAAVSSVVPPKIEENSGQEIVSPVKRGRGRPRKITSDSALPAGEPEPPHKPAINKLSQKKASKSNGHKKMVAFKRSPGRPRKSESKGKTPQSKRSIDEAGMPSPAARLKSATTIEDILPDLRPKPSGRVIATKRSVTEAEKASQIVKSVTEPETPFVCLACDERFENYDGLTLHKISNEGCRRPVGLLARSSNSQSTSAITACRSSEPCESEYSECVSNAIRRVPETTFNSMHGTLQHVDTETGKYFRSRPSMGALEKVKLNVSGPWSTKDVWESGGWEIGKDPLSWHKYESAWSESRMFLQRMSSVSWPQQRQFKAVFDQSVVYKAKTRKRLYSSSSESEGNHKKNKQPLPLVLDLKQQGRSVKTMTTKERERDQKQQKRRRSNAAEELAVRIEGELNGEWELGHTFMCSVCSEVFDELREVMHHKWDAHPYCLVAHVTLQERIRLPPATAIYPQLGRQLKRLSGTVVAEKRRRSKVLPQTSLQPSETMSCSKCSEIFNAREEFHKHLLVCGGDELWDQTTKKKKKKRKSVANASVNGTSNAKKKESNGRHSQKSSICPICSTAPRAEGIGRVTRLQTDMIKKSKAAERTKKSKRGRKPGQKNGPQKKKAANPVVAKKPSDDSPLPNRLRRSMVNYARDVSLRECWETTRSSSSASNGGLTAEMLLQRDKVDEEGVGKETEATVVPAVKQEEEEEEEEEDVETVLVRVEEKSAEVSVKPSRPRRRASMSSIVATLLPHSKMQRRSTRLSLDGSSAATSRPISPTDSKSFVTTTTEATTPETPKKDPQSKPSDRKVEDDSEESDNSSNTVRVVKQEQQVQHQQLPSRRACSNRTIPTIAEGLLRRMGFPVEVKIGAIERILNGDTQSQVARDLQVPLSTVASWWHRRGNLLIKENSDSNGTETGTPEEVVPETNGLDDVADVAIEDEKRETKYPIVPYKRNQLLLTMKKRIEEAFKHREVGKQEPKSRQDLLNGDAGEAQVKAGTLVINRSHHHKVVGDRDDEKTGSFNGSDAKEEDANALLSEDEENIVFNGKSKRSSSKLLETNDHHRSNDGSGEAETRSSSGLSLILDSYKDMDGEDMETDEIS